MLQTSKTSTFVLSLTKYVSINTLK